MITHRVDRIIVDTWFPPDRQSWQTKVLQLIRAPYDAFYRLIAPALRLFVRRSCRGLSLQFGLRVSCRIQDSVDREVIEGRLISALGLLAERAPRHLKWLQRDIIVILITTQRGGGQLQLLPEIGLLRISAFLVWQDSVQVLAMELVAVATRFRFQRASVEWDGNEVRIARRAASECVWLANRLPSAEGLREQLRQRLSKYPLRRSTRG